MREIGNLPLCSKCQEAITDENQENSVNDPISHADKLEFYETIPCCGWWLVWEAPECSRCGEVFFRKIKGTEGTKPNY